jgi:hypothetical protein
VSPGGLRAATLILLQKAAQYRIGDRLRVDVILTATNLLSNFVQAHVASCFSYRLGMP